jgi:hypothetical protein
LLWRTPDNDELRPSRALQDGLDRVRDYAQRFLFAQGDEPDSRERTFLLQYELRRALHQWLAGHFVNHPDGPGDAAFLGVDPNGHFEVHTARFSLRPSPDGYIDPQFLVGILQERPIAVDPQRPAAGTMPFEGGCTIVADLRRLAIRYCVRKSVASANREQRQQAFAQAREESSYATYFGVSGPLGEAEPFAAIHRGA